MEETRFDTYCGLYCGACEILNARTEEQKQKVVRDWREMWTVSPEQVTCRGCKTEKPFLMCRNCRIKDCASEKGLEFCYQCPDYPCEHYRRSQDYISKYEHLQHWKTARQNLEFIRTHGVAAWLEEQKSVWSCPDCATHFSWYMERCPDCGRNLRGERDYERAGKFSI